jgi:hypothetical protein
MSNFKFAQPRPLGAALDSQAGPLFSGSPFQDLPTPTGQPPYRLDLADVLPDAVKTMNELGGMIFHITGDTGGVLDPAPQLLVANGLQQDAEVKGTFGSPAFLYHMGDVIYFDGQAAEYYPQFYRPYEHYPNPILAIPGNHDGDRFDIGQLGNPEPSLATFVRNFCQSEPGIHSPDARDAVRTAMIQPNVYWTLLTPFATFVGLYTNVPEGGVVMPDQQDWFAEELKAADSNKPLIVAMHHPIHSLDKYHSGSKAMAQILDDAVLNSGRSPDIVFAGHVHNYQSFTVGNGDGQVIPFIVMGNGGYHNLTEMAKVNNQDIVTPYRVPNDENVILQKYVADRFGFLRVEISPDIVDIRTYTVPRPQEAWRTPPRLFDQSRFDWRKRRILMQTDLI